MIGKSIQFANSTKICIPRHICDTKSTNIKTTLQSITSAVTSMQGIKAGAYIGSNGLFDTATVNAYRASIKGLSATQAEAALSASGLNAAQRQQILTSKESTVANAGQATSFNVLTKAVWANVKAMAKWLVTTPTGWITLAIGATVGLISAYNNVEKKQNELIESARKLQEEYRSFSKDTASKITSLSKQADDFEELSKGVDKYGNNVSLASDEYDRYKSIVAEILGYSPELIQGYDAEGNAIADKNSLLERSIELLKEEQRLKLKEMTTDEKTGEAYDAAKAGWQQVQGYEGANTRNEIARWFNNNAFRDGTNYEVDIAEILGIKDEWKEEGNNLQNAIINNIDTVVKNIKEKKEELLAIRKIEGFDSEKGEYIYGDNLFSVDEIDEMIDLSNDWQYAYNQWQQDIEDAKHGMDDQFDLYAQRAKSYNDLTDAQKVFVDEYIRATGDITDAEGHLLSEDKILEKAKGYEKFVNEFAELNKLGEGGSVDLTFRPEIDTAELNKKGWEAGEGFATVFSRAISNTDFEDLMPESTEDTIAINFTPIIVDPNTGEFKGVLSKEELYAYAHDVLAGVREDDLNLQIGAKFEGKDAINEAVADGERIHYLHEKLFINNDTVDSWDELRKVLIKTGDDAVQAGKDVNKMTVSLSQMKNASDGISSIASAFKELHDEGYVSIDTITSIKEVVGGSVDNWDDYEKVLLTAKEGSAEFDKAMSDLTYTILENQFGQEGLVNATEEQIAAVLRENGVLNDAAVASEVLARAKEKERIKKVLANGVTDEVIQKLAEEASKCNLTEQAYYELIAAEIAFGSNNLNVEQKITQINNLRTALGLAAIDYKNLSTTMGFANLWGEDRKKFAEAQGIVVQDKGLIASGKGAGTHDWGYVYNGVEYDTLEEAMGIKQAMNFGNTLQNNPDYSGAIVGKSKKDLAKERAEKEKEYAEKVIEIQEDLAEKRADYAEKVADINEELAEKEKQFAEDMAEAWEKEHLEQLKDNLKKQEDIINKYKENLEISDFGLDLFEENDFGSKSDLLSGKIEQLTEYGVEMRKEFERVAAIIPKTGEEAQELADRLTSLGEDMRDNVSAIRETKVAIEKLRVDAFASIAEEGLGGLQAELDNIDRRLEILRADNKDDFKYTNKFLSMQSLLPTYSELGDIRKEKQKHDQQLIKTEQSTQDKINAIVTKALEMQAKDNAAAREKERQKLIEDMEKARRDAAKKLAEANKDLQNAIEDAGKKLDDATEDYKDFLEENKLETDDTITYVENAIADANLVFPEPDISKVKKAVDQIVDMVQNVQDEIDATGSNSQISSDKTSGKTNRLGGTGGVAGEGSGKRLVNAAMKYKGMDNSSGKFQGGTNLWCAGFVSEVAKEAGISGIPYTASVQGMYNHFSNNGRLSQVPSVGAIVMYDWKNTNGTFNHVGIVTGWDDNYIYTIEGNTSGGVVAERKRARNSGEILGFGTYAQGTSFHPGGLALVGDENWLKGWNKPSPELAIYPDGSTEILGKNGVEIRDLPKGTSVIPAKPTKDLLENIPSYASGVGAAKYQVSRNLSVEELGKILNNIMVLDTERKKEYLNSFMDDLVRLNYTSSAVKELIGKVDFGNDPYASLIKKAKDEIDRLRYKKEQGWMDDLDEWGKIYYTIDTNRTNLYHDNLPGEYQAIADAQSQAYNDAIAKAFGDRELTIGQQRMLHDVKIGSPSWDRVVKGILEGTNVGAVYTETDANGTRRVVNKDIAPEDRVDLVYGLTPEQRAAAMQLAYAQNRPMIGYDPGQWTRGILYYEDQLDNMAAEEAKSWIPYKDDFQALLDTYTALSKVSNWGAGYNILGLDSVIKPISELTDVIKELHRLEYEYVSSNGAMLPQVYESEEAELIKKRDELIKSLPKTIEEYTDILTQQMKDALTGDKANSKLIVSQISGVDLGWFSPYLTGYSTGDIHGSYSAGSDALKYQQQLVDMYNQYGGGLRIVSPSGEVSDTSTSDENFVASMAYNLKMLAGMNGKDIPEFLGLDENGNPIEGYEGIIGDPKYSNYWITKDGTVYSRDFFSGTKFHIDDPSNVIQLTEEQLETELPEEYQKYWQENLPVIDLSLGNAAHSLLGKMFIEKGWARDPGTVWNSSGDAVAEVDDRHPEIKSIEEMYDRWMGKIDRITISSRINQQAIVDDSLLSSEEKSQKLFSIAKENSDIALAISEEAYNDLYANFADYIERCKKDASLYSKEVIDAYSDMFNEVGNLAYEFEKSMVERRESLLSGLMEDISEIDDYIATRNHYNDWDNHGDNEVSAIYRQAELIEDAYTWLLSSYGEGSEGLLKDYADKLEEYSKKIYSLGQSKIDKHLSNIDRYIDARNLYNDWDTFDDSEIEAIKRQCEVLDEAYRLNLMSLEEYTEKTEEYTQKLYSVAKQNIIDTISELIEDYEEIKDLELSQLESQKTLLQSYYDVANAVTEAQHEIDKELRASMTMYEYLDKETRELLFNQEDYDLLSKELLEIQSAANQLQKQYEKDILDANAETIAEITSQYQMQYETMMKQYEIAKAELDVAKKRQQLDNVLAERNTRMFVNGQWQWVAKTQDVINAQNELAEAEIERKKQEATLEQTEAINDFTAQIGSLETDINEVRKYWADMQELLNGEADEVAKALKEISQVSSPELKRVIKTTGGSITSFSATLTESTTTLSDIVNGDYGLVTVSTGISNIITDLQRYSEAIQGLTAKIKGANSESYVGRVLQVGADGNAPAGATIGDIIVTAGGNFKIVTANTPNAKYNSESGHYSIQVETSSGGGSGSTSSSPSGGSSSPSGSSPSSGNNSSSSKQVNTSDQYVKSSSGNIQSNPNWDGKKKGGVGSFYVNADGSRYTSAGLNLIGEEGFEAYISNKGRLIPINQPTIGNIGAGGIVFNREQMANLRNLWDLSNLGKISPFVSSSNANSQSTVVDNSIHINGMTISEKGNEDWINGFRRYVATHR